MGQLKLGRVGLDIVLKDPQRLGESVSENQRILTIAGQALLEASGSTLADTLALRSELLAQTGRLVAVTYDTDPTIDGFYMIDSASLDTDHRLASLQDSGLFPFTCGLTRIDTPMFQSRLTGTTLVNTNGITATEDVPYLGLPVGVRSVDPPAGGFISRSGADGAVIVLLNVVAADHPIWYVTPASYYLGAARITVGGYLRAGLDLAHSLSPTNWRLENGLVRVDAGANGGIDVAHHDGTVWDAAKGWDIQVGGVDVGDWDEISIIRNDAEAITVRLFQGRTAESRGRHTLDLSLRRGSRFVTGIFSTDASATLKVVRAVTEAATAITGGVRATANDGDGNRYVVASPDKDTDDLTNGGISLASTTVFKFMVGSEVGGTGAATNDVALQLVYQYHGHLTEKVFARSRGLLT